MGGAWRLPVKHAFSYECEVDDYVTVECNQWSTEEYDTPKKLCSKYNLPYECVKAYTAGDLAGFRTMDVPIDLHMLHYTKQLHHLDLIPLSPISQSVMSYSEVMAINNWEPALAEDDFVWSDKKERPSDIEHLKNSKPKVCCSQRCASWWLLGALEEGETRLWVGEAFEPLLTSAPNGSFGRPNVLPLRNVGDVACTPHHDIYASH